MMPYNGSFRLSRNGRLTKQILWKEKKKTKEKSVDSRNDNKKDTELARMYFFDKNHSTAPGSSLLFKFCFNNIKSSVFPNPHVLIIYVKEMC